MKKILRSISKALLISLIAAVPGELHAQTTSTVSVVPVSSTVAVGATTSISINIANVNNLGTYEFKLLYNPALIQVDAVTNGSFLASTGRTPMPVGPSIDNTAGSTTFGAITFGTASGPSGSGTLATIAITTKAAGVAQLMLENVTVADINAQAIPFTVSNSSLNIGGVSASPSPSTNPSSSANPSPSASPVSKTVYVQPGNQEVDMNLVASVDININDAQNFGAYEFALTFDPQIVEVTSVTEGGFLGSTGRTATPVGPTTDNVNGKVTFGAFSFGTAAGPQGNGKLATVTFTTKAVGSTNLAFENVTVTDIDAQTQAFSASHGSLTVRNPNQNIISLNAKLQMQGLTHDAGPQFVNFVIEKSDGTATFSKTVRTRYNSGELYITSTPIEDAQLVPGTYNFYVSGPVHLTEKFTESIAANGTTTLDLTSKPLLSADIAHDNKINDADFNRIYENFGCDFTENPPIEPPNKMCEALPADLDFNDRVDIYDYSYLATNYNKVGVTIPGGTQ